MSAHTASASASLALGLDQHRLLRQPAVVVALSFALVAVVAAAEYVIGFEVRLSILYLLPIAFATWLAGRGWGMAVSATATVCWLLTFQSSHVYPRDIYYYWDGAAMVGTFVVFVLLLARLRGALERSDERFIRVVEGLSAPVYVSDDETGDVLFANARCAELVAQDGRAVKAAELAARLVPEQADAALGSDVRGAADSVFRADEVRDHATGRWYLAQVGKIRWVDGRWVRLNVLTDITEHKEAQEVKRAQREALYQSSHLATLAEIASTLAHELNQPLVAIASYNEASIRLLHEPEFDREEVAEAMEKCRAQAVRAGEIMRRMRDFIRRRQPNRARDDLNEIVRGAAQLAGTDGERDDVKVVLELTPNLLPVYVDRVMIEQVVLNLVKNALEAMRSVEPTRRRLTISTAPADEDAVLVSFSDRGEGIPEAVAERLFRPFLTTRPSGLGLGLSICRSIVEAHGGRLWYVANPEGGSTFHLLLPGANV